MVGVGAVVGPGVAEVAVAAGVEGAADVVVEVVAEVALGAVVPEVVAAGRVAVVAVVAAERVAVVAAVAAARVAVGAAIPVVSGGTRSHRTASLSATTLPLLEPILFARSTASRL
jgi:hypothetical protein